MTQTPSNTDGWANCGHCGFPINPSDTQRYFGTFTAHLESRCRELLNMQISRLEDRTIELTRQLAERDRQLAEAQRDAERYRWLNRKHVEVYECGIKGARDIRLFNAVSNGALDYAIDAAIQEQKK